MNDLKKLVAKANSSLSPRQKKSNSRYGLANFIASRFSATTPIIISISVGSPFRVMTSFLSLNKRTLWI